MYTCRMFDKNNTENDCLFRSNDSWSKLISLIFNNISHFSNVKGLEALVFWLDTGAGPGASEGRNHSALYGIHNQYCHQWWEKMWGN